MSTTPRTSVGSKIPSLGRRRCEVVVAPIEIRHGSIGELRGINAVEGAQVDGIEDAAVPAVGMSEGAHAASPAEAVMDAPGPELLVRQLGVASEQADIGRADSREPGALLRADRAVALDGARA